VKSRKLILVTAITLFAVLAIPIQLAAQEQARDNHHVKHHHYKLIDIGTFGGPASFFNATFNSVPALNNRGLAVGDSGTSTPIPPNGGCFFCGGIVGLVPFVFHAFELREAVVIDLGALPPVASNSSIAQAITSKGDNIVGASENAVIDPLIPSITEIRAVVWREGQIIDLGTLGGNQSAAFAINDRGQVAGFSTNAVPDPLSILYFILGSPNGTQTRAFLWDKHSGMQDLGSLGGGDAFGTFLNRHGQVAGFSYTNSTPNATTGLPTIDPFLWDGSTMLDLGTLGGTNGNPTALNNGGQVIGFSNLSGDNSFHPFLWEEGKLIDLYTSTVGGNPITANAINDAGEIVGAAAFPAQPFDAYLWRHGVATDLGHLKSDCSSEAWAMNSAGQIVVISFSCDGANPRAALWEDGSLVDLNTLIPAGSSLQLFSPQAINDRGEIAGLGLPSGCSSQIDGLCGRAFVLIPCDENHQGFEGCDYSVVDVPAAVPGTGLAVRNAPGRVLPQSLLHRMSPYRFSIPAFGPRN
jgi:probable HAF family extracellular repeat protein